VARHHYSEEEIRFVEQNWKIRTDKEIGRILSRTAESVERQRKKMGWHKKEGRPSVEGIKENMQQLVESGSQISQLSISSLTKEQRIEIYKANFTKNPRFSWLMRELHEDEVDYYRHKYTEFMDSLDTITIQEEDSLHHMIMADIGIGRIRRMIRDMEQDKDENSKALVFGLYETLDKAEKKFVEYQKILRFTREARLKESKEEKENIASVFQMYRARAAREEMGKQAGLMEVYKEKCKEEMKTSRYLLGE
jgi:hypothetical protein